jgi:serine/threonine-protein kinase
LQHAHHHGQIHGGLHPLDIMIDGNGDPHIQFPDIPEQGTPAYEAPESLDGTSNRLDGRADIYSVGVMLYECLTSRRPFEPILLDRKMVQRPGDQVPAPPRQYNSGIPTELERICLRCLAGKPAERYLTASDLAADLQAYSSGLRPARTWSFLWPFRRAK